MNTKKFEDLPLDEQSKYFKDMPIEDAGEQRPVIDLDEPDDNVIEARNRFRKLPNGKVKDCLTGDEREDFSRHRDEFDRNLGRNK